MQRKWLGRGRPLVLAALGVMVSSGMAFAGSGVPVPPRKTHSIPVSTAPVPDVKPDSETLSATDEAILRYSKEKRNAEPAGEAPAPAAEEHSETLDEPGVAAKPFLTQGFSFGNIRGFLAGGAGEQAESELEEEAGINPAMVAPPGPAEISPPASEVSTAVAVPPRKPAVEIQNFVHVAGPWKDPKPPRRKPMPVGNVPLSDKDAALYRKIFAAQARGDMDAADGLIEKLGDFRLRGHVLFQRYMHPTAYVSTFEELQNWLGLYADHPDADKVYALAVAKKPARMHGDLREPKVVRGINGFLESGDDRADAYKSERKRNGAERKQIAATFREIRRQVDRGSPSDAWKRLNQQATKSMLDETEYDILRSYIAYGYLHSGKIDKAYELSTASVARSGVRTPLGAWVSGLIAWRRGEYGRSANFFEVTARSPHATGWMASGAAYWASRAHMRAGNVRAVSYWLNKAASYPRTFYGLIATRALGRDFDFNWDLPKYTKDHEKSLMRSAAARRAMALLKAGQFNLAEAEMRRIETGEGKQIEEALLAYAAHEGMPAFAMRLANAIPHPGGGLYDAALYPIAPWQPKDGFKVDLALVHAIIRQESRFDPSAENRSGATGLMQLMPATAGYVAGSRKFKGDGRHHLKDPMTNIDLGQQYIHALLNQNVVSGDLFSLTIAYNAGPGNLAKWKNRMRGIQDPLLFVESIPVAETRAYVERVLANYWIYRLRLGQPTPTLDAVASGRWARYVSLDDSPYMLADTR